MKSNGVDSFLIKYSTAVRRSSLEEEKKTEFILQSLNFFLFKRNSSSHISFFFRIQCLWRMIKFFLLRCTAYASIWQLIEFIKGFAFWILHQWRFNSHLWKNSRKKQKYIVYLSQKSNLRILYHQQTHFRWRQPCISFEISRYKKSKLSCQSLNTPSAGSSLFSSCLKRYLPFILLFCST